jgi:hypothetical protein
MQILYKWVNYKKTASLRLDAYLDKHFGCSYFVFNLAYLLNWQIYGALHYSNVLFLFVIQVCSP